jgi:hypothetical protein
MYCSKCGEEITINDKFCPNCGSAINQVDSTHYAAKDVNLKSSISQEVTNFVTALYLGIALYIASAMYEFYVLGTGLFYFFGVIPLWLIGIIIYVHKREQSGYVGARDISFSIVIFSILGLVVAKSTWVILIFISWIALATYFFIKLNSQTVKDWCYIDDFHQK